MNIRRCLFYIILNFGISACGGGESSNKTTESPVVVEPPSIFTGIFLDSAVEGLHYKTSSNEGVTNTDGEFIYQMNENVIFSIGGITFPAIAAKIVITPLDIFATEDINNINVINMLRLLQSLDFDGDASNGIQITQAAHDLSEGVSLDFSSVDFDSQVETLLVNYGGFYQQLVSTEMALYHFQQTLIELNNQEVVNCDSNHSSIGRYGYFETIAHGVSGRAEIIDNCTIKVTEFYYDGRGPKVNFYVAQDHDYANESAFAISREINGPSYENSEFILRLPNGKTLNDFNTLSVWCVEFGASFGELVFTQ